MAVFVVPEELDGITVQNFLRRHCQVSARLLARLKRVENGMTVSGKTVRSIDILHSGDEIVLCFPQDDTEIVPVEMPIEVIFEDEYILAVNKPPFMPVHPVHEHQLDTLANAVMYYAVSKGENYTFRAVNRLDRDTSGIVLVAKNGYTHTFLSSNAEKTYYALCEGEIKGSGTIDSPIRIKEGHTIQRESGNGGVRAVTHYAAIESRYGHTLLKIKLETGRTHQIRTHFSGICHPLAGDEMYGGSRKYFERQCLHCAEMKIIHPMTRRTLTFFSPPENWLSVLEERIKNESH